MIISTFDLFSVKSDRLIGGEGPRLSSPATALTQLRQLQREGGGHAQPLNHAKDGEGLEVWRSGASSASLIAGNPRPKRLTRFQEFWRRIEHGPFRRMAAAAWGPGSIGANTMAMAAGMDGFFQPNPWAYPYDPIEGFILLDASMGRMINEG